MSSGMADVYIIGTHHHFQTTWQNDRQPPQVPETQIRAFKALLQDACTRYPIRAIAEEMNLEALANDHQSESTCKQVADRLGLPHRYCDPDTETRNRLGIPEGNPDIHMAAFFAGDDPAARIRRFRAEHEKRERYWLEQLKSLNILPSLFICGASHAGPFAALVAECGFESKLLCRDWGRDFN